MEPISGNVPALQPPPGVTSDFDNPSDLSSLTIALVTSMSLIILLAVCSRVYTKAIIMRKMTLEDCK